MRVAVFDTYVTRKDGGLMHFDVIVPEGVAFEETIRIGREYLKNIGQGGQPLTATECRFCHIEEADEETRRNIEDRGYFIYEMEGCE